MTPRSENKVELRVFVPPKLVKDIDGDLGRLGSTRSEVAGYIIKRYYDNRGRKN